MQLDSLKEFGGKTWLQIVSLPFVPVTRATGSPQEKIARCGRATASEALQWLNSIGFKFTLLVIFSLPMNLVFASAESQSAGSNVQLLKQSSQGCGGILGKVFVDLNHDDFQDANEIGLSGIKLTAQNGLQLITDNAGRFNSGCIHIPADNSHSTIVLKLDPHSFPPDYYLKDGNFRETILSPGQIANLGIGVSRARIVQLSLRSSAFENETINLKSIWLKNIDRLMEALNVGPAVLRVTYVGTPQEIELAGKRTIFIKQLIEERRKKLKSSYKLPIEIRLVSANG